MNILHQCQLWQSGTWNNEASLGRSPMVKCMEVSQSWANYSNAKYSNLTLISYITNSQSEPIQDACISLYIVGGTHKRRGCDPTLCSLRRVLEFLPWAQDTEATPEIVLSVSLSVLKPNDTETTWIVCNNNLAYKSWTFRPSYLLMFYQLTKNTIQQNKIAYLPPFPLWVVLTESSRNKVLSSNI